MLAANTIPRLFRQNSIDRWMGTFRYSDGFLNGWKKKDESKLVVTIKYKSNFNLKLVPEKNENPTNLLNKHFFLAF